MQAQLETRLKSLKQEFEAGTQQLNGIEQRSNELRNTLLRISGAIQVLEEILTNDLTQKNNIATK